MALRLLAITVVVLGASSARADDTRARARSLFESGTAHYNLAEYRPALEDFKEAYRITHDPTLLFNIAQCHRQLGEPAAAANFYRSYRREAPQSPNRDEVDRLIDAMEKAAAAQKAPPQETIKPATSQPLTPAVAEPSTSAAITAAPPPPRPVTKRAWFWVTVGGAALVVAGVTVGIVLGTSAHAPTPNVGSVNAN
jgi:hypothetical protein